jgi:TonB-linked SusC/RagA family outer membrane protein
LRQNPTPAVRAIAGAIRRILPHTHALAVLAAPLSAQGGTTVRGTVTEARTNTPIPGATVRITDSRYAALTNDQGQFVINGVANGTYVLEARRIGYSAGRTDRVRVAGQPVTVGITLNANALSLEAVTVSASTDPTSGIKSPFAISTVTAEMMPVPATAAASTMLIGKVAGLNIIQADGAPGAGSNLQMRTPSSILKGNSPLFMIDGILLNETQQVTTQDIETMNIESIEVIKGAAAAALYGSRAASGVIAIKTQRGKGLALGSTQFTMRNDFGYDQFHDRPVKRSVHHYRVNAQGQFIDANGVVLPRASRQVDPDGMVDNPYAQTYDNIGQVFRNGRSMVNSFSVAQNSAGTNYTVGFTRNSQPGVIKDTDGYLRQQLNFTIDHSLRDNLSVGVSATHSRANEVQDEVSFTNLYAYDPDVDLTQRDANGFYLSRPDSASTITNPLYLQQVTDNSQRRARTLVSGNFSYRPTSWFTLSGDAGYDRGDLIVDFYTPPGLPASDGGTGLTTGSLRYDEDETDGLTMTMSATGTKEFGALSTRLTAKGEQQRERNLYFRANGSDFLVKGIRDMAGAATKSNSSSLTDRRINAGIVALGLDYGGKYIGDFLVRREGNSLFGNAHRWSTFYRAGGSYLMSNEGWWPRSGFMSNFSTFKLRYNVGSAGTRPDFADQYSAIAVGAQGLVRDELGNPDLAPEIKTDQEVGIDMIVKNRLQVLLTYSNSKTRDNIVGIAAPSATGFNTKNANVGSTHGETWEATFQGAWIEKKNFKWSSNMVFDRSKGTVDELNRPCYGDGIRYYCNNSPLTQMWGQSHVRSMDQLRAVHANSQGQFQVNDQGFVVAVGNGNSWKDGVAKNLWGTQLAIDGVTYRWGEPIVQWDEEKKAQLFHPIGNGEANLHFGLGNTFNYKKLQLYFLLSGQLGGDVYNNTRQSLLSSLDSPEIVQVGVPDSLRKPYYYYSRGVGTSNTLWIDTFVEKATYAKLYELQLAYQFDRASTRALALMGASSASVQLIGRNLFTWTNYTGLRPDGGSPNYKVDGQNYPIARNYSLSLSLVF